MPYNRELFASRPPLRRMFAAKCSPQVPQITIRGDKNLINLGTSSVVTVRQEPVSNLGSPVTRKSQWPQQILDAIRLNASKTRRSHDEVCELATRVLGRPVVTLDKLSARELARVYEALCETRGKGLT